MTIEKAKKIVGAVYLKYDGFQFETTGFTGSDVSINHLLEDRKEAKEFTEALNLLLNKIVFP